jgi:mRNA interferase MazF
MNERIEIRRGDIVDVDLGGARGVEKMNYGTINSRPCIVVQNDRGNTVSPLTQVVPLTGEQQFKGYPVQVLLKASEILMPNSIDSSAECGHVRTIDRRRIINHRGVVKAEAMDRIDRALRISLSL